MILIFPLVIIYQSISFSFMMVYLDYWSIIPILIIITSIMVLRVHRSERNDNANIDEDDIDDATGLVWDGDEWVKLKVSADIDDDTVPKVKRATVHTSINMNLIIISICDIFAPCFTRRRVFVLTDLYILIILSIIYCMINFKDEFNYELNILDNSKFNFIILASIFLGVILLLIVLNYDALSNLFICKMSVFRISCIIIFLCCFTSVVIFSFKLFVKNADVHIFFCDREKKYQ